MEFKWRPFVNYHEDRIAVFSKRHHETGAAATLQPHVNERRRPERENMVRESRKCLLEATFPVRSGSSSPLIAGLMKHDFGAEAARRERQQDVFNLPENLEAQ